MILFLEIYGSIGQSNYELGFSSIPDPNDPDCFWRYTDGHWGKVCTTALDHRQNPQFCHGILTIYHDRNQHYHSHTIE